MFESKEVTLTNGEKVRVEIGTCCNQNQIFSRMGPHLIAGVVQDPIWQGVYFWQEVNGSYVYVGDIVLRESEKRDSVIWDIYPFTTNDEIDKRSVENMAEKTAEFAAGISASAHVRLYSSAT